MGGPHCEIWKGLYGREGEEVFDGETVGGGGAEAENVKVSLGFIASIPLRSLFSGSVESTSNNQNVEEDV